MTQADIVGAAYDAVFTGLESSPTLQRIWREYALGDGYPPGFEHLSFVTSGELEQTASALHNLSDGVLIDIACGTGGPGLWVARAAAARLIGIDVSRVAVNQARARSERLGVSRRTAFIVGRFDRLPARSASADAIISFDAIQYAPDKMHAFAEMARTLRPEGRLLFTAFEVHVNRCAALPVFGLDPVNDFRGVMERNGFTIVEYGETAAWRDKVTATYEAIRRNHARLVNEMGSAAAAALAFEVSAHLDWQIFRRRVRVLAMGSPIWHRGGSPAPC